MLNAPFCVCIYVTVDTLLGTKSEHAPANSAADSRLKKDMNAIHLRIISSGNKYATQIMLQWSSIC